MIVYLHPHQLCNTLMSVGVPSIVKPYYENRVDPLPIFKEFLDFIATYSSPEFLLMREIAKGYVAKLSMDFVAVHMETGGFW